MDRKIIPVEIDDFDDILMENLDDILESPSKPEEKKSEEKPVTAGEKHPAAEVEQPGAEAGQPGRETERPAAEAEQPGTEAEQPAAEVKQSGTETEQPEADAAEIKNPAPEINPDRTPKPVGVFARLQEEQAEKKQASESAAERKQRRIVRAEQRKEQVGTEPETKEPEAKEGTGKKKNGSGKAWRRAVIIAAGVIAAAVIGAYGYGVYYYSSHFLPTTVADDVRLDNLTVEEAQQKLTDSKVVEDSILLLHTKEGDTVPMSTEAMGIRRNYLGLPEALEAQEKWLFPINRLEEKILDLKYEVVCDKDAAMTELEKLDICDPRKTAAPVNAYVAKNGKKIWKVVPADDGNTINREKLADAIGKAVENQQSEIDLEAEGVYETAAVREDDPQLNRRAELENKIDALKLVVDIGANTTAKITPDDFRSMIRSDAWTAEAPEQIIDEKKFNDYLLRFASTYNTKSASGWRTFKSISGETIVLESDYGWELDQEATGSRLKILLEDAAKKIFVDDSTPQTFKDGKIEAVWKQEAVSHGARDTGNTFVEVNITKQKMYCVIKGTVVLESNIVSGMEMNSGRRTPGGIYTIRFKQRERDLVGYNSDGTEAYRSHVSYWMPFNKNIGLHDASWRGSFGGKTYLWNGSHGCVNLPVSAAKKLYDLVEKGTPVIVYRENSIEE